LEPVPAGFARNSAHRIRTHNHRQPARAGWRGTPATGRTWLQARFAFFEDGGRLVHLGLLAPEAISASLDAVWQSAIQSFMLAEPQGQNAPLGPGMGICPEPVMGAEADEPKAQVGCEVETEESAPPQPRQFTDADSGFYAKSDDLATLDPEHPVNARLRDQGVGFVPKVLETDLEAKTALLGASAIRATIRVALGWHVNDDGRRTLLLDPAGKVQISLHLISKEGRSVDQILDNIQQEASQSYSEPELRRFEDQGIWALWVRNIEVNNEPVEQVHLLTAWTKDSAMLRARVTSDPASTHFALNYACHILKSAERGHPEDSEELDSQREQPPCGNGPDWMRQAEKLEREDRMEEAEQLIRDRIPSLHCAITIAELYRTRWIRLRESDPKNANKARNKAAKWARTYPSWATSGGEGAALSLERDEFLRRLGPEPMEAA